MALNFVLFHRECFLMASYSKVHGESQSNECWMGNIERFCKIEKIQDQPLNPDSESAEVGVHRIFMLVCDHTY